MIFSASDPLATADDMAQCCIRIAKQIEAHTSGDADVEAAMAEVLSKRASSDDDSEDDRDETEVDY
jgi:hypothetical protein